MKIKGALREWFVVLIIEEHFAEEYFLMNYFASPLWHILACWSGLYCHTLCSAELCWSEEVVSWVSYGDVGVRLKENFVNSSEVSLSCSLSVY